MIISCSRRTDIPAFYSDWFINRIRAGYCYVPNPFNPKQIVKVSLEPQDVTAFVFWSRYPEPLIKHLSSLDSRGYKYYFQISLNNYGMDYEKNNPNLNSVIKSIKKLENKIGKEKIIWRYDPLILDNQLNYDFHIKNFNFIIDKLKNSVGKIITSVITPYRKILKRVNNLDVQVNNSEKYKELLNDLNRLANENSLKLEICSYFEDLTSLGIKPAKCIDIELLNKLFGLKLIYHKDKNQRKYCMCSVSKDIGMYNSCIMNCSYCYATTNNEKVLSNYKRNGINSETLY